MITLAIETSTERGSVAIIQDGKFVFSEHFIADRNHSSELFASLARALEKTPECDQIVVGLGPGSYSGVRIAIAAAIGLKFGTRSCLIGVSSIAAMETIAPCYQVIGDARRDTFYYAQIHEQECFEGPILLTEEAMREKIQVNSSLPIFSSAPIKNIPALQICYPSAKNLARMGEQKRCVHSSDNLEPIYLRDPHITNSKS